MKNDLHSEWGLWEPRDAHKMRSRLFGRNPFKHLKSNCCKQFVLLPRTKLRRGQHTPCLILHGVAKLFETVLDRVDTL